jgi:tetratricopeptide (TPR) repeat protein
MKRPSYGIRGPALVAGAILGLLGYQAWSYSHTWRDSVSLWAVAVERDPENAQALSNLGLEKLNRGLKEEAFEHLSRAIQLVPGYAPAYVNRGNARMPEDPAGAIADYDTVIRMYPDKVEAYANRGVARIASKDHAGGMADFDKVLSMDPNHYRALVNRGLARLQESNLKGARADLDRAVKLRPGEADGWYIRALAREAEADYPGAFEDCRHALSIAPRGQWMHAERAEELLARLRRRNPEKPR